MVAFVGLFVLIITGTIDWDDVLSEQSAWDTLIWFGALIMMAEQLNKQGVIKWFSEGMSFPSSTLPYRRRSEGRLEGLEFAAA